MLVVTLKLGESIRIGRDTEVRIVRVCEDGRVRVGVEAPRDVPVIRPLVHTDDDLSLGSPPRAPPPRRPSEEPQNHITPPPQRREGR